MSDIATKPMNNVNKPVNASRLVVFCAACVVGCAASPPPSPQETRIAELSNPHPMVMQNSSSGISPASLILLKQYLEADKKEIPAMKKSIVPAYIERIDRADKTVRSAVSRMLKQGSRPSKAILQEVSTAVAELDKAIAAIP